MLHHRIFTRDAADANVFTRDVTLSPSSWNAEQRTFSVVVSSGADVVRQDARGAYIERPDINQNWRALVGAPVLNSHQRNDIKNILGSVTDVAVVGQQVHATIRMSKSPEGEAAVQAALEGHLRGISFGYRIDATKESVESGQRIVTITKLTPVEISLVPIPADPAAVIRSGLPSNNDPVITDRATINTEIRSIARITSLPQQWVDTQIDLGATVDQARAAAFDELKKRSAPGASIRTATASIAGFDGNDPAIRSRAIGEALATRLTGQTPPDLARDFVGLTSVELCRELLRTSGLSTLGSPGVIVERAMTTSDLPALMGDAINRSMRLAYQAVPSALKLVARQRTASDFRMIHRIQLSAAPTLEKISESGEFVHGAVTDSQEQYKLETFGRIISLSRQVLINDDLGALADLTRRMGQAAAAFEAQSLVTMLESPPVMSDGFAVFSSQHRNLAGAGAVISETSLSAGRLAMRSQTDPSGMLIAATPKYLLVPPALETLAEKTVTSIQATQTSNVNPFAFLNVIVEPRLSDAKAWYLVADPATIDGLEYAYLAGEEGPQTFSREGWSSDGIEYKIREDFGAGWSEPRGYWKQPGA
jgi:Caudovirus prohead serine protease